MEKFDVVVIGTGLGGAAASAILAHGGLRVLVLEKNPRIGGSCSWYEKEGFRIDMGTHTFGRGNKGPLGEVTRRLGLGEPIEFKRIPRMVHMKGFGMDICMPPTWILSPLWVFGVLRQMRLPPREVWNLLRFYRDVVVMPPEKIDRWNDRSLEEFLSRYTQNPRLLFWLVFSAGLYFILPPNEASAGESILCLQNMTKDLGPYYPMGGASAVPQAMLDGAKTFGAEIRTSAGAREIVIGKDEEGRPRAEAVVLEDGSQAACRAVVSTTSLKDTVGRLAGAKHFPRTYVDRIESLKGSYVAVQAKIALKKPLVKAGVLVGGVPLDFEPLADQSFQEVFDLLEKGRTGSYTPVYAPIPTNFDPSLAPKGEQIITACSVAPTTDKLGEKGSAEFIDDMMSALRALIPGLDRHTIFCDTFSVEALEAWIGKSGAPAVTTAQTLKQVGANRPPNNTPVRGLYVAGDGAGGRGIGTELAARSGIDCAEMVIRDASSGML